MVRPSKELCKCGREKSQIAKTCFECRKKLAKRICKFCGKEYECKPSVNKIYCSKECRYADTEANKRMHESQTNRVELKCKQCGKLYEVPKSRNWLNYLFLVTK